ncbi:hypothetical protein BLNAU_19300 [Blattamonas nauphoetae]|uniref:Uncharacterized protein n=1 Tax=Blattamonas nauphoetae TaxID=2049346 RepID=A0ABQ9X307_9EUKA|nr:hypothetical protein BLNAU_19300 [Blattamonas nauphoetae]
MLILPLLSFVLSSNDWYHDLSPDIATVVLKTSPNNENWQEKSTIRLDSIKYQSNAVRLESRHVVIVGNGITRTDVFEGRMNKGTLFSISNSTCSFSSLSFHPHTSNVLHAAGYSFCEVSQSKIVLSDPVSPFECTDSTLCIDSTDFVVNTPSNTVQSLVTTTRFSSSMKLSSCSLQDILVASDSSLTASSLIQRTIIDSCHLQNISHVAKRTQSPPVTLPFNVTVCCSSFVDCVNTLSGGVVRNVEDQTTLRAINNTFTRTISNGHDEGKTFENLTEADIVEEDHSYLFCVFRNCTGTQTAGGAIRCRAGFSVSVTSCEFYDNEAVSDKFDYEHILADGGAIHFNGQSTGGLTIVQSLFERNTANVGGSIGSQNANHLNIQYSNITDGYTIYYNDGKYSYGAGIALNVVPMESIMKNIRFLNCTSEQTGGSIDCNYMSGSITFSNLFIAHSTCTTGNVIFSNVKDKSAIIQFFSCTFFENIATDNSQSYPSPSDVRYYNAEPWLSLLLLKSTFVNCFSNSPTPKIGILNDTTYTTTFNYGESPNSTELDVHLPDPAVIVNEQEGEDKPGCGAKYDNKCNTIAYAGKNRMAEKAGIVLIEAGRFQETDSFDLDTKSGSFTSFGDLTPIISFALSDGAPAFVTKGTGTVRFEYLHFVPSADTSVILQNGNGVLEVVNCVFLNTDELNPLISTAILKAVEGAVSLSTVEFSSLSFDGGCCVECVGTSSKLDISNCKFLQTKGVSLAQIVFEPSTPDSAVFSMKSTTLQGQEGTGVGGLKLTNVASVTVESVTMRRLESKTQKAAISIAKCSSLTLSSLLFELNSGTDASDLFVDSESLPVVSSTSSFSVSPSPTTSINGEQSDTVIPRQVLLVDASSAAQGPFCWATDGCKSISSLLPRLPAGVDWSLSMKEGIVGDLTLSMPEKQSIAVTGTSQAGSILQHTSLISSAFVEVSTGSLSLSQLTLATASTDPTLSSSFFIVSGGSLSLESVLVPSLSFSNSAAFAELTGSGSLSLKSVSFSDMSNEGSGSVVHSTSTGTISLDTVSFTRCNCGVNGKGRSVLIEPSSPFTATSVVMKDVTIEEEGTSGSHEVFLNGSSIPVTITSSNFGSTLGALADQTQTTMAQFVGEETSDSTMSGPLAYLLHRHETGTVYVDSSFWNHKFCGLATLPCQTLEATHEKLNENNQIVDFSSDLSMTGTVTSKATSSTIQSTATKTLTLTGSAQFVVSVGVLTLNALKLTVEDITTSRTSALVSVTTGSLAVSACSITIIDQTNTVPLVSVEGGSVISAEPLPLSILHSPRLSSMCQEVRSQSLHHSL